MATTSIEWTDKVWNPVTGCTKVSQGCKHCYAETIANRFWGERKFTDVRCHPERLEDPLKWRKPSRVFVNSMSDLFHPDVPLVFVAEVFQVMKMASLHTFQILTKRPDRMLEFCKNWTILPNVWLGVSVEDQRRANERIPLLLQTPAAVRFVSCEPLLEHVDIYQWLGGQRDIQPPHPYNGGLSWVICGGESGPHARPMHPDWARSLRDQCVTVGVPFFFKQHGEWTTEYPQGLSMAHRKQTYLNGQSYFRVGKKIAGRLLDGREWNEYPKEDRHD